MQEPIRDLPRVNHKLADINVYFQSCNSTFYSTTLCLKSSVGNNSYSSIYYEIVITDFVAVNFMDILLLFFLCGVNIKFQIFCLYTIYKNNVFNISLSALELPS